MDPQTIAVYDRQANDIAARHHTTQPERIYSLIKHYFHPGGRTADIGCGSGRDTAWLAAQGYQVAGFDASEGMLERARAMYPQLSFRRATLPELSELAGESYANLLCSAVVMHLPAAALVPAVAALARLLQPGGRLILTYRGTAASGEREADGRLVTRIDPDLIGEALAGAGLKLLFQDQNEHLGRPGVLWHTFVAEQ